MIRLRSLSVTLLGILPAFAFSSYPIDLIYNITGKEKIADYDAWRGAELAAIELNKQHIPVSLNLYDGQSKPQLQHAIAAMRAQQKNNPIMIGLTRSDNLLSVATPITQANKIFINTSSTSKNTRHQLGDHYFSTTATLEQQAKQSAIFLRKTLKQNQAVVISGQTNNDKTLAISFSDYFSSNNQHIQHVTLLTSPTKKESQKLIRSISDSLSNQKKTAVYLATSADDAITLLTALRTQGFTNVVMTSAALSDTHMNRLALSHIAPFYYTSDTYLNTKHPSSMQTHFKQTYQERYNRAPSTEAALGYDAVMLAGYAIAQSKTYTSQALTQTLKTMKKTPMVTGKITLNKDEPIDRLAVIGVDDNLSTFDATEKA